MNTKLIVLLVVLCAFSNRLAHADEGDDFVHACKVAADSNRTVVEATVSCDHGKPRIASLGIHVITDADIQRWRSTVLAHQVEQVEIAGDVAATLAGPGRRTNDNVVTSAGLRRLAGFPHLRKLIAHGFVKQTDIDAISNLKLLEDIDLSDYSVISVKSKAIGRFKGMPGLKRLDLLGLELGDASVKDILPLTGLQELDLQGNEITENGIEELSHLADLRSLSVGSVNAASVAAMKGFPHLEQLRAGVMAKEQDVIDLSQMRSLTSLNLRFVDNRKTTIRLPQNVRRLKLKNIEAGQLDLGAPMHITEVDIDLAAGYSQAESFGSRDRRARDMKWLKQLPELSELTLQMLKHNEDGEAIAALTSLRGLTIVSSETPPGFSEEAILAQLDGLKRLESFHVGYMNGLFPALQKHPTLQQLGRVGLGPGSSESFACLLSLSRLRDLTLATGKQ